MKNKIINILGFLLVAVLLTPFVTSAAIGVTWTATSSTPGLITPTLINGYAPGIGVTGNSSFNIGLNSTTGFGSSTPYADLSIHANNGETNQTLFAIGSSTQTSTSTLFTVDNIGTVHVKGGSTIYTNIGQYNGGSGLAGIGFGTTPGIVSSTGYSLLGDGSNTYLNAPASGTMYFRQGNALRMQLNTSGNFGIGTTSISQKLHVAGNIALQMDATDSSNAGFSSIYGYKVVSGVNSIRPEIRFMNLNALRLFSSGISAMPELSLINSGVGVGSTTQMAKLSVHGNPTDAVPYPYLFAIGSSTQTATTTLLTVDNGGNLVTTGTVSLGSGAAGANLVVNGGTFRIFRAAVGDGSINVMSGGINLTSTGFLALNSNSVERARFLSTGQYGIGTTSPTAKVAIHANNGETNQDLFAIASSTQTATTTLMDVDNIGNITSGNSATASTTRTFIGKWQMDTYNTAGTNICAFFVGTTLSASTGPCIK